MADGQHAEPERPAGIVERWRELSPVRLALYPVVAAVVGMLVVRGYLIESDVPLILAAVAAVLGIAGTETARREAWSPATVSRLSAQWSDEAAEWQAHAADEYARGARDALHASPDSAARCRDVRGARRCLLDLGHEGVHLITAD